MYELVFDVYLLWSATHVNCPPSMVNSCSSLWIIIIHSYRCGLYFLCLIVRCSVLFVVHIVEHALIYPPSLCVNFGELFHNRSLLCFVNPFLTEQANKNKTERQLRS